MNMTNKNISKFIVGCLVGSAALTSCSDSFLDKIPDERVEINTVDQVIQLLSSGYCATTTDGYARHRATMWST